MKNFTILLSFIFCYGVINAQNLLFDNGPLVNSPGLGVNGADVSNLHSGITLLGFGHAVSSGFRVADDFTIPSGATWIIDSMIFFTYQTQAAAGPFNTTSTINEVNAAIWNGSPASGGAIIFGDTTTDRMSATYWSGIYRTGETTLTNEQRPLMRDQISMTGCTLAAGTYWVSWQTGGTLASGPWVPPITINGVTATGDGLQFNPGTSTWDPAKDTSAASGTGTGEIQGFPFEIYGHLSVGLPEHSQNFGISKLFPVPAKDNVSLTVDLNENAVIFLSLKDCLGREVLVKQQEVFSGRNVVNLNVAKQSAGVYFLTVTDKTSTVVSKFIKE